MPTDISIDSFKLGQSVEDISVQLGRKPHLTTIPDDKEVLYDFRSCSFKVRVGRQEVIAILGGSNLNVLDSRVSVGDALESVIQTLGEPDQKVEEVSASTLSSALKDQYLTNPCRKVVRLVYRLDGAAITIFFNGDASVQGLLLRTESVTEYRFRG